MRFWNEISDRLAGLTGTATPEVARAALNEFDVRDIQAVRVSEGGGGGGSQPYTRTDPLPISAARLLTLGSVPLEIVPAPGPGFILVPTLLYWFYIAGGTPYDGDNGIDVNWDGDTSGLISVNAGLFRADNRISYSLASSEARKVLADMEDTALVLSLSTDPVDGDGSAVAILDYAKIAVPS